MTPIFTQCPATLYETNTDDCSPLAADQLQAHDSLDCPEAERGCSPEEPGHQPHLVTAGKGRAKSTGKEQQTEYDESFLPANFVRQDASNEDSDPGAGKERCGPDLSEDVVSAQQVELLRQSVGEPAGVELPGVAGQGEVGGVMGQVDISVVQGGEHCVVPVQYCPVKMTVRRLSLSHLL